MSQLLYNTGSKCGVCVVIGPKSETNQHMFW